MLLVLTHIGGYPIPEIEKISVIAEQMVFCL